MNGLLGESTREKDGVKYEIYADYDYNLDDELFKWEKKRIEKEELSVYGVIKKKKCDCCNFYGEAVDSLWGIVACDADEALEHYLSYYNN
jgi:hypothetical protein